VLGFRREAVSLLGRMVERAALPVLTTGAQMDALTGAAAEMLEMEFKAGDVYGLGLGSMDGFRYERGMPIVVV